MSDRDGGRWPQTQADYLTCPMCGNDLTGAGVTGWGLLLVEVRSTAYRAVVDPVTGRLKVERDVEWAAHDDEGGGFETRVLCYKCSSQLHIFDDMEKEEF